MTTTTTSEVDRLAAAALWYAWGRLDEAGDESKYAQEFSDWYRSLARAYDAGEVNSRPSILDAWEQFSREGI